MPPPLSRVKKNQVANLSTVKLIQIKKDHIGQTLDG